MSPGYSIKYGRNSYGKLTIFDIFFVEVGDLEGNIDFPTIFNLGLKIKFFEIKTDFSDLHISINKGKVDNLARLQEFLFNKIKLYKNFIFNEINEINID